MVANGHLTWRAMVHLVVPAIGLVLLKHANYVKLQDNVHIVRCRTNQS